MSNIDHAFRLVLLPNLCLTASLLCPASPVAAQEGQQRGDGSRQIIAEEFTGARPKSGGASSAKSTSGASSSAGGRQSAGNSSGNTAARPRYKRTTTTTATKTTASKTTPATNKTTPAASKTTTTANKPAQGSDAKPDVTMSADPVSASLAKVGVTIWRLRAPQSADQGARLLVQGNEMVPERVASDAVLSVGDSVFLSIESPREGYLYIVDRELFSNGKLGDPYLIFPTKLTRGGDNRVRPGKLINIPDRNDNPNNFKLLPLPNRSDQVGELLSIIITSEPLENFKLPDGALLLTSAQIEKWEDMWGGSTEQYDLENGAGQTWSQAESEAAKAGDGSRLLTQGEPPPQTVYLTEGKNTKGLLVNVQLRYRRQ